MPCVRFFLFLLSVLFFLSSIVAYGEVKSDSLKATVPQRDLIDIIKTNKVVSLDTLKVKKLYLPIVPLIGYTPANGFILGAGAVPSIYLGNISNTRMSSGVINVQITSMGQLNCNFRSNVYLPGDKIILQGDWRLLLYSQPTYGLGIYHNSNQIIPFNDTISLLNNTSQSMRFDYYKFHERVYFPLYKQLYVGFGFMLDWYNSIVDQSPKSSGDSLVLSSHWAYSVVNKYDPERYSNIGFSLNTLFDTRDNSMNPYEGWYFDVAYRFNPASLNESNTNSKFTFDFRNYWQLNKRYSTPSILAIWLWGDIKGGGSAPYLTLPSIGWDTYNRSGRGYVQGRFRGQSMVYAEVEYRFPLTKDGLLGAVLFLNSTTASLNKTNQDLFDAYAIGYGSGLRVRLSKATRLNLCLDICKGKGEPILLFFGVQEAF